MISTTYLSIILSCVSALVAAITALMLIISLSGASVDGSTLEETSWVNAKGTEEAYIDGKYYAGINAIYFVSSSNDKDVIKYTDCADEFDVCKKCHNQSIGVIILLIFGLICTIGTLLLSIASTCVSKLYVKCCIVATIGALFIGGAYSSFGICYEAFQDDDSVRAVEKEMCYETALAAIPLICLVFVLNLVNHSLDHFDKDGRVVPTASRMQPYSVE
mmetsp:Transcript_5546/g.8443  ORF Transcript_5546/g.8443 Transcript_5546/m.8443 type:complete len:218 (-) Transcript_5546:78-731(-)